MPRVQLQPSGRGVTWIDAPEDGATIGHSGPVGSSKQEAPPLSTCHTCKHAMLVRKVGTAEIPLAYCKLVGLQMIGVTQCSDWLEEKPSSPSTSSAAPSAT